MKKSAGISDYNYYESLFNNSRINALLVLDTDGKILTVNPAFTNAFGYESQELEGRDFAVLFTLSEREKGMPLHELSRVLATGQADDKNYLLKKNGDPVWVSGESILAYKSSGEKCILKVIQDISAEKNARDSVSRMNDFNEGILTTIDDVVVVLDAGLNILKTNPAFYDLFKKINPVKAVNDFNEFLSLYDKNDDLRRSIQNVIDKAERFTNVELEISTFNGESVFAISGRKMYQGQNETRVLLVGHDITFQKKVAREREDILGFVAHELRNPLSNIILCNQLLEEQDIDPDMKSNLVNRSRYNITRLNKMISELYEATKVSSGNFTLEVTEFSFDQMVQEAIDTVQVLQPSFNITIEGTGGIVRGDRDRLIQVVTNYLSNSIKYSNGNTNVRIKVSADEKNVTLAVIDKGAGIPSEQVPFLFDRFFRAEKTKDIEGIGLGLYLCRRIIESHNGRVWVESTEGQGSAFYFQIPLTR